MIKIKVNLPNRYQFELKIGKTKGYLGNKALRDLGKILHGKTGNKISNLFRFVFEREQIKKVLGTNLAFLFIASSLLPARAGFDTLQEKNTFATPIVVQTQIGVQYPVKSIRITQGYRFYHPGLDLDGIKGDAIYPIMAGKVVSAEYSRFGYGNNIIVDHGNKTSSLYAHLSKIEVQVGQEVSIETKLGDMGSTGRAFGDHLHLEIYEDGKQVNPQAILASN